MKPDPKAEGLRWLRQAQHDLSDAEYSLAGRRYSLACFLSQQAAEKALKAYLSTRYPNSLPGGIPAEAFDESDARRAVRRAGDVIGLVQTKLGEGNR